MHKLETQFTVTDLVNVSYYKLPKNYENPGESHDFWELVYIDKGELVVTSGTRSYLLKAGELAFHCPNEYHALQIYDQKPCNIIIIAFCCTSPYMQAFKEKILFLTAQEKQCMSALVKEAESAYVHFENVAPAINLCLREDSPFGCQQMIKNYLEQLLVYVYRHNGSLRFGDRAVSTNQSNHHARIAEQIREYMAEHFNEKITLETLAAAQSISVSQLKHIFKEQIGTPAISYLTSIRISEAKRMIQENNLNFTQIAEAVGYDNIYYFSSLFKKRVGMTLTEYSKSVRR